MDDDDKYYNNNNNNNINSEDSIKPRCSISTNKSKIQVPKLKL